MMQISINQEKGKSANQDQNEGSRIHDVTVLHLLQHWLRMMMQMTTLHILQHWLRMMMMMMMMMMMQTWKLLTNPRAHASHLPLTPRW